MFSSWRGIVNQSKRLRSTGQRSLARLLAATIFPPRCCLCGFPGASLDLDLCAVCHADLPWEPASSDAVVALRYEHPVDEMIRRLKYQGVVTHARVLGVLLAEVARQRGAGLPRMLVPVPLHAERLRERGFNQAAALARYAGRILEIPVAYHALRRVRDTPSQTALARHQRHENVIGAFAVGDARACTKLAGAGHVALVDDVMTTGSTLVEARSTLLAAGVKQVDLWAVARVE